MDRQEDFYEKLKAEVWEKMRSELLANETQYEPVSRKEVFNYAFDMGYKNGAAYAPKENIFHITQKLQSDDNLGNKHARGNDGMVSVSIDVVKTMYDEAKKTCSIFTKATCINAIESENLDKAMGAVDVLEKLFGKDFFDYKDVEPKHNTEQDVEYIPIPNARLQVATAIMQALISRPNSIWDIKFLVGRSVSAADALIAEVSKKGGEG